MNDRDFNITVASVIKSLPYQLRAPFLYRSGLYDGVWYTVSEVAHYLRLDGNECRERLRLAAEAICEQLGAALEEYIRGLALVEESFPSELATIIADTKAPWNSNDVALEMQNAVLRFGASFTVLGQSDISEDLVGAVHGGAISQTPQVLVQIAPRKVDFIEHVVATVFCQRKAIGEHRGGSHLGVFGMFSPVDPGNELTYLDVDLLNRECVDTWLARRSINQTRPPDEPFLFEPP